MQLLLTYIVTLIILNAFPSYGAGVAYLIYYVALRT